MQPVLSRKGNLDLSEWPTYAMDPLNFAQRVRRETAPYSVFDLAASRLRAPSRRCFIV